MCACFPYKNVNLSRITLNGPIVLRNIKILLDKANYPGNLGFTGTLETTGSPS